VSHVVVPVRYPLTDHSKATLREGIRIAADDESDLTILHVNLYQRSQHVSRTDLKTAVEAEFGSLSRARYVVRSGFVVEETILDEIAAEGADVVVIGHKQTGSWRRMIRRLIDDPDIERYLQRQLDCTLITVGPPDRA
jgi:nucleotide-binding universal stress UspA family protein